MTPLFQHWSMDPFLYIVALIVVVHARGLRAWLRAIQGAGRPTTPWIQQALLFYAGLGVLIIAVTSPVDYWSEQYLSAHVAQHILLAFFAPPLIVIGAPWLPIFRGLPKPLRHRLGRLLQISRSPRSGSARSAGTVGRVLTSTRYVLARPLTSVVLFNSSMVFWHFPGPFDLAFRNQSIHIWLEHSCFFLFGLALWLQIFGSYPLRPLLEGPRRIATLIATNAVMVLVAMTLVMFTRAIYPAYAAGHTIAQRAADQQIGGAILWVCGEISFLPAILYIVVRWLDADEPEPRQEVPHNAAGIQAVAVR